MLLVAAVLLALASAGSYAVAAVLQQGFVSHYRGRASGLIGVLARRPLWWASVAAMALGALLHMTALGLGPLVLVQPLGVSTLVFALLLRARRTRRPLDHSTRAGAFCVVAGLAATLAVIPRTEPAVSGATSYWSTIGSVLVLAGLCAGAALVTARHRPAIAAVLVAAAAALCFGLTSGTVKALWLGQVSVLAAAVGLVSAAAGFVLVQHAYRGGLAAPLAVATLLDPLTSAVIGVAAFGEPLPGSPGTAAVAVAGVLLTVVGVARLCGAETDPGLPAGSVRAREPVLTTVSR